jgi:hypothetical protein
MYNLINKCLSLKLALVKPYEPNFYVISTGHTAKFGKFGELETTTEMTETAKFQSFGPRNFLAGRNGCKSSIHASINKLSIHFILHKSYQIHN